MKDSTILLLGLQIIFLGWLFLAWRHRRAVRLLHEKITALKTLVRLKRDRIQRMNKTLVQQIDRYPSSPMTKMAQDHFDWSVQEFNRMVRRHNELCKKNNKLMGFNEEENPHVE